MITSWHGSEGTKLYVNFELAGEKPVPTYFSSQNTFYDLRLATANVMNDVARFGNFTIDEVHIWQRRVTNDMIREIQLRTFF